MTSRKITAKTVLRAITADYVSNLVLRLIT